MSTLTITRPQLQAAMHSWIRDVRAGRTIPHAEADAMPEGLLAVEQTRHLWELLVPQLARTDIPTEPGTPFQGGFYAGRLRIGDKLCAIIVSPKSAGDAKGLWGEYGKEVAGAGSYCDGLANTLAMAEAGSQLAQCTLQLDIGGFKDWYIPARDELELLYRAMKPTTDKNLRYSGDNPSAVPPTWPYSPESPTQTPALAFQTGGAEALEPAWYWSSTQYSAHLAGFQWFADGYQGLTAKGNEGRARAVRRLVIE